MKQRIQDWIESTRYIWEPIFVWLAPVLIFLMAMGMAYLSVTLTLPEALAMYSSVLFIITFFFVGLFLLSCVPCAIYSCVLAIKTVIRQKKYWVPIVQILLNLPLLALWYLALQKFLL